MLLVAKLMNNQQIVSSYDVNIQHIRKRRHGNTLLLNIFSVNEWEALCFYVNIDMNDFLLSYKLHEMSTVKQK